MSGDILTVKTVKRVRSIRGSALVHIKNGPRIHITVNTTDTYLYNLYCIRLTQ